jgi:hypothetical protein
MAAGDVTVSIPPRTTRQTRFAARAGRTRAARRRAWCRPAAPADRLKLLPDPGGESRPSASARTPAASGTRRPAGRRRSDRLHRRRPIKTPDRTYLHFEAFEVAQDERPSLLIASRPPRPELPRAATVVLVGLAAGLAALALAAPLRRERAAAARDAALAVDPGRAERDALYDSLRDLEHDFETGKLEAADYERMRAELRGRALDLLEADRSGPAAALPAAAAEQQPAAAGCSACGNAPAPGDRFCARCGARLLAA